MVHDFFLRLDGDWNRFWIMEWSVFGFWALLTLLPCRRDRPWERWNHPALYAAGLLLAFIAFRWPSIGVAGEYTVDESQFLAGALTVLHRHTLWAADTMSSGPLTILPLTLPALFGWPVDYVTGRCVGLLLNWGTVVFVWLALRHVLGDGLGRILVMPMACMLLANSYGELIQYASEHAPLFYLALALWLIVTAFDARGIVGHRFRLALGGAALGLLPFSKLQAAPLGLIVGLFALTWIWLQPAQPGPRRWRDATWLVGGVAATMGLILSLVAIPGEIAHFYRSYVAYNIIYAQNRTYPWSEFGARIWFMTDVAWGFYYYLIPTWVMTALVLPFWPASEGRARRLRLLASVLFAGGYYVVAAAGHDFQHYLLLLVLPTSFFLGTAYGGLISRESWPRWARTLSLVAFLGLGVWPQFRYYYFGRWTPHHGEFLAAQKIPASGAARIIRPLIRPGDTLAVWGWGPGFHVETQLPQATREVHTERQISPSALRDYFRTRYLAELTQHPPAFFVDAVGENNFGFHGRTETGHETFLPLRDLIASHYRLVGDIDTTRIYVRLDRLADLPPGTLDHRAAP